MSDKNNINNTMVPDEECDYLIIGGGACGMAFADTLLAQSREQNFRVVMVDKHDAPGGQWHDSYDFVRLHQPSSGYGVESRKLEPVSVAEHNDFSFVGNTTLDLAQLYEDRNPQRQDYVVTNDTTGASRTIRVRKRLVDARNLEPDLPVSTPPTFAFSPEAVSVVPVNDIKHFVVIGGGKTGMDAVYHLLTEKKVALEDLLWVVPNDAWITARENIGNCIDLLHTSASLLETNSEETETSSVNRQEEKKQDTDEGEPNARLGLDTDFFQRGFLEWERAGHVYRLDPSVVPTKFKDATLSQDELETLRGAIPRTIKGNRVAEITDGGRLVFVDGSGSDLPFPVEDTLFVHCSAGAFHCSRSDTSPPPIFEGKRIIVRDVYGTPGYCFVGSVLGKIESLKVSDATRNAIAETPSPPAFPSSEPPSGGDVLGAVTRDHPFVQRAHNLRRWLDHPDLREWVVANRLFHMAHSDPKALAARLDRTFEILGKHGIDVDAE
eukprot:jgi/Psemu1/289080/fgenesh1_pg.318_\